MEIHICDENCYHLIPQVSLEVAHDRVEQKKTQLVAGTVGALFARSKPEDIQLLSIENRVEPYWRVSISGLTVYDRSTTYSVLVGGPEVKQVTVLGQDVTPKIVGKEGPRLSLNAVEHCRLEAKVNQTFNAMSGERNDMSRYQSCPKTVVMDLGQFAPEGVLVVHPQVGAAAVLRQVMGEVIKPVQNVHTILEETVTVEALELNYRPVYAFEFMWAAKAKQVVVEFDPLTGDINSGGRKLSDQVKGIKGLVTRDLLFDVTADALDLVVPGSAIAVKLVKAVVDHRK